MRVVTSRADLQSDAANPAPKRDNLEPADESPTEAMPSKGGLNSQEDEMGFGALPIKTHDREAADLGVAAFQCDQNGAVGIAHQR